LKGLETRVQEERLISEDEISFGYQCPFRGNKKQAQ
jgi:hypothetical protein